VGNPASGEDTSPGPGEGSRRSWVKFSLL